MKAFAFRTGGFLWKVAVEVAVMRVGDGFRGGIVFSIGMIALQNNLIDSAPDVKAGNQIERKEGGQDNQNNAGVVFDVSRQEPSFVDFCQVN